MSEQEKLLDKIRALGFVKTELELYLDTHPDCAGALEHYYVTLEQLREASAAYEGEYGPLTAAGVQGNTWTWIRAPWPWQTAQTSGADAKR